MEVEVRIRHALGFGPVMFLDDFVSPTPHDAAERMWRITNAHPDDLDAVEAEIRLEWERLVPGHSVGVGDVIVADGTELECTPNGWY